jgi:hypothetical protein
MCRSTLHHGPEAPCHGKTGLFDLDVQPETVGLPALYGDVGNVGHSVNDNFDSRGTHGNFNILTQFNLGVASLAQWNRLAVNVQPKRDIGRMSQR